MPKPVEETRKGEEMEPEHIFLKEDSMKHCMPPVDHYPIHGPARLAFKWKENMKRKCGLIFEFWKIRPRGGTVLLWSCHLLLF